MARKGFPYGTLTVNTLGCLLAGFLSALTDQKFLLKLETRVFWIIGLLGAFTTFSSLIYESWQFIQDGKFLPAGANLLGSLLLGLPALWAGHVAASLLS